MRAPHEPEMKSRDVGIANECLWVALEDLRHQIGNHAYGAVATCAANNGLDPRVEPHTHEVLGATFVFGPRETAKRRDLRIEQHRVACALQRFDAAREPAHA